MYLLHAVIARLLNLDLHVAMTFVNRWKATPSLVHVRLWAAMARDARLASADDVATFILSLSDEMFWNLHQYPELAELRARRFAELNASEQARVLARIRRHPPGKQFSDVTDSAELKSARLYYAAADRCAVRGGVRRR